MRIIPLIVLLACIAFEGQAQDNGEARPAASRGLLKRGLLAKGKPTTTTTTTPGPQEEVEYEDDAEYPQEGEPQVSSTEVPSSTEGKKLVGSGVRPFRSNADLLETLKRRRAQAAEAKLHGNAASSAAVAQESQAQTEAPAKASYSKKRYNSATRESNNEDAPATAKPSRNRFNRPSSRSFQEPEPEEQNESAPSVRTGRTFSRRGGN